MTIPVSVAIGP